MVPLIAPTEIVLDDVVIEKIPAVILKGIHLPHKP